MAPNIRYTLVTFNTVGKVIAKIFIDRGLITFGSILYNGKFT